MSTLDYLPKYGDYCLIERHYLNHPTQEPTPMQQCIPTYRQEALYGNLVRALWEFASSKGLFANMDEKELSKYRECKDRVYNGTKGG